MNTETTIAKKSNKRRSSKKTSKSSRAVIVNNVTGTAKFGDVQSEFSAQLMPDGMKITINRAAPTNLHLVRRLEIDIAESIICIFNKRLSDLTKEGFNVQIAFNAPAVVAEQTAVAAAAPAPVKRGRAKSAK